MDTKALSASDSKSASSVPVRAKLLRFVGRQTWLPKGRTRIPFAIWHPESGKSCPFVVDFFGFRYPGDLANVLDWNVFTYGSAAPAELALLAALSAELRRQKPRIVFFDVGANVGHHTLFMARHADEIIAFEPFPPVLQKLREKIDVNRLTNVRVVPLALGDTDGQVKFYPGSQSHPGQGSFVSEDIKLQHNSEPFDLEVRRGDELSSELALPPMDILKIDVEGFEPPVLRGFRERIHRDRPAVLMEMSNMSRSGFRSEKNFRDSFWEGAVFAGVAGDRARRYRLVPFRFSGPGAPHEILALPPEMADFMARELSSTR